MVDGLGLFLLDGCDIDCTVVGDKDFIVFAFVVWLGPFAGGWFGGQVGAVNGDV